METRAPAPARIALMAIFAFSCIGLLIFLWLSFGGSVPLKPKGYRFAASFDEAPQLAEQAEVRISGVPVGKVVDLREENGRTRAEIEMEREYAPISSDAKAILRSKTLLGETYVELTPGTRGAPRIPEGGALGVDRVGETVELDEVLRTFDPETRRALQQWLQDWDRAIAGRGADVNAALGNAPGFAENAASLLEVLHSQRAAVRRLVRDGGRVAAAIGRRDSETQRLIVAGEALLDAAARRERALRETVRILPTTLRELRPTLEVARATGRDAAPLLADLRPAAPKLRPALADAAALAPDLKGLFEEVDPLIDQSRTALPALTRIVRGAGPLIDVLYPVGRELPAVVDYLGLYKDHLTAMFSLVAAASEPTFKPPGADRAIHYLRVLIPMTTEAFVTQPRRLPSNRHNPYLAPRGMDKLKEGLEAFDCENLDNPQTLPVLGSAPPCKVQPPIEFRGQRRSFPRLERDGP